MTPVAETALTFVTVTQYPSVSSLWTIYKDKSVSQPTTPPILLLSLWEL